MFTLAALNDAVDLMGLATPLIELALDILTAVGITIVLGGINPWLFILVVADVIPGLDFAPFWTLYVLYRYIREVTKRRVRVDVA